MQVTEGHLHECILALHWVHRQDTHPSTIPDCSTDLNSQQVCLQNEFLLHALLVLWHNKLIMLICFWAHMPQIFYASIRQCFPFHVSELRYHFRKGKYWRMSSSIFGRIMAPKWIIVLTRLKVAQKGFWHTLLLVHYKKIRLDHHYLNVNVETVF